MRVDNAGKMTETNKKNLNLSVEEGLIKKARGQGINISEITEKVLRVFTASSENVDKEKMYKTHEELFNIMLPLLQKFRVTTIIAREVEYDSPETIGYDEDTGEYEYADPIPTEWFDIRLQPDGKLYHDTKGEIKINDINIGEFLNRQDILDEFFDSIQKGVNYRTDQFKEIEMAKTIIDAITKGTIPKSKKSKGKGGKRK